MIVVKLIGGLGNQMFQYTVGRYLAEKHNVELKLDLSWFNNMGSATPRTYELGIFNIIENFATDEEKNVFNDKKILNFIKIKNKNCIIEKHYHFDPAILNLHDNVCLEGYWQSEKYFKNIENIIRQEFNQKKPLECKNLEISKLIQNSNAVSLHVRRGDYVTNQSANVVIGLCNLDYYLKSIDYIAQKIKNPHFFIFSDDPEWTKDNINIPYNTNFIDWNKNEKSYIDMQLMSMCRHNIIANSSFSWWSAWLNSNTNKTVISPQKWFNNVKLNTQDLIPGSWIRM